MNKNLIAVTIGDINGIGIELLINIWLKNKYRNFVLFTNESIFKKYLKTKKLDIKVNVINNNSKLEFKNKYFNIYNYKSKSNIENTINSINYSYQYCKNKYFIGIITLPIRKDLLKKKLKNFIGHTEYFQKMNNKKSSNMIFIYNKVLISTLTTHVKLSDVNKFLKKKDFIINSIITLNKSLINDIGIKNPKILISGVNPHSGENTNLGLEEKKYIIPAIKRAKIKGINILGPIPGDSMLIESNLNKFDCFLFIFHDQALIPFKYISKFRGVNFTGNLDIIRTSPDHGTAYNLIGKKLASDKSILNCFRFVKKINGNRSKS